MNLKQVLPEQKVNDSTDLSDEEFDQARKDLNTEWIIKRITKPLRG